MMNRRFGSVPSMPTTPAVNSTSPNRGRRHSSLLGGCGFLLALVTAFGWPTVCLASGTFYVDGSSPSCSATGPGTEGQPYCTISAALTARGGPGTTILVKPGTYREDVAVRTSGAAGSPLVVTALGGPVIIDGADDFGSPAAWASVSGEVYLASSVSWAPNQVFSDGARLTPSTATPGSLPANSFTWVSGAGLYVNLGGDNPGTHELLVGHRLYGFHLSARSYVTIDGFTVTRAEDRCIQLRDGCTNVTVSHNTTAFANHFGIQAVGGSGILIDANTVSDNNDHGINLTGGVTGSTVQDNESFRNARPAERAAKGIYLYGCPGNLIQRNRLHHNQDSGLQIQSGSNNCVSLQNCSWANGDHGFDHLAVDGTLHVGDVAFGNYKDGFSVEVNTTGTHLYNCIGVDNGLTTNEFDLWVDSVGTSGFVSDNNIFWNSAPGTFPVKYINTMYTDLKDYARISHQDKHSLQADPRFANGPAADFHLLAGSPAIDAADSGVPGWPATDADGSARVDDPKTRNTGAGPVPYADRGAFEFAPTVDHAPVVTAPATAVGTEGTLITFTVTASDPDGQAITSLTASGVPKGAQFQVDASMSFGTFTWTPSDKQGRTGPYSVTFKAKNALSGSAVTAITVNNLVVANAAAGAAIAAPEASADSPESAGWRIPTLVPNPVRGDAVLSFALTKPGRLRVSLYDLSGRRVRRLVDEAFAAPGLHQVHVDPRDEQGARLSSGVYFFRIDRPEGASTGRFLIMR